jgi:hypothetical protein
MQKNEKKNPYCRRGIYPLSRLPNVTDTQMKRTLFILLLLAAHQSFAQGFKPLTSEPLHSTQEELKVKGRQGILIKQKLSFGNYYTTKVKRSAIRRWSSSAGMQRCIWAEHAEGKQSIHFELTDGSRSSNGHCVSNVISDDMLIGHQPEQYPGQVSSIFRISTGDNENNFSVALYLNGEEQPWELFLSNNEAQYSREHYIGFVDRGKEYYTITPIWKVEKKNGKVSEMPFGNVGFEIRDAKGEAKAAVSLIDNGRVYMGQLNDDERFLMANVCAALLLQGDISQ